MSRPTKLTDEVQETITTALTLGASMEIAAIYARITERTLYLWQERGRLAYDRLQEEQRLEDESLLAIAEVRLANKKRPKDDQLPIPERYKGDFTIYADEDRYLQFFQALQEAKGLGAINHLNHLNDLAPSDPKVSMWILERRFPEAFGQRPQQVEHSGPGGQPIETKDVSDISMDERIARIQAVLMAAQSRKTAEGEQDDATDDGGGPS